VQRAYLLFGLRIVSDWAIDEWAECELPALTSRSKAFCDVSIRWAEATFAPEIHDYGHDVPRVGTFFIRRGEEIIVRPETGSDRRQINAYLTASAWGALCYQRGVHLLHVSSVRCASGAFAFAGPSGAGKSSIAASLVTRGYAMLGDDTARLEASDIRILLHPGAPTVKLWRETLDAMGFQSDGLNQVMPKIDKYQLPVPRSSHVHPIPLVAVYILEWGLLGLCRQLGADAVRRFLATATYRPEFLDPLGRQGEFVQNTIQIAGRVPIYVLTRPRDFSAMDDVVTLLERHWNDDLCQTRANPK
jgi:hypothetical protein